jgi:hypothetical protein
MCANRSLNMVPCPLHKRRKEPVHKIVALDKDGTLGTVNVSWSHVTAAAPPVAAGVAPSGSGAGDEVVLGHFSIREGRNLLKRDSGDGQLSDPYFLVFCKSGGKKMKKLLWKSDVFDATLNPVLPAPLATIPIAGSLDDPAPTVVVEAWNANPKPERDTFLGMRTIALRKLVAGDSRLELQPRPKEVEALIARLEGRLGWITVVWAPSEQMIAELRKGEEGNGGPGVVTSASSSPAGLDVSLLNSILASTRGTTTATDDPLRGSVPLRGAAGSTQAVSAAASSVASAPAQGFDVGGAAAGSGGQSTVVPVEITDVVPILVADDYGDSLFTELRLDSPIGELQPLIQAHFNVHVCVQVLKCNGQLVQPHLSLRRNGCLLLLGEPYIKIHMSVAKGPTLALVFILPDKREVPLAFPENTTVKRVKESLCTVEGVDLDPTDIRLLWRYNELNDKATLEYYRVVTRTRINVAKKPHFFEDGGGPETAAGDGKMGFTDDRKPPPSAKYQTEAISSYPPYASGGPGKQLQQQRTADGRLLSAKRSSDEVYNAEEKKKRPTQAGSDSQQRFDPSQRPPSTKRASSSEKHRRDPSPPGAKGASKKKAPEGQQTQATGDFTLGRYTVDNRPRAFYEADGGLDDPELGYLRRQVRQLEAQVAQQTSRVATEDAEARGTVQRLERKLAESDRLLMDALSRIAELEGTVRRYQELVQRMA